MNLTVSNCTDEQWDAAFKLLARMVTGRYKRPPTRREEYDTDSAPEWPDVVPDRFRYTSTAIYKDARGFRWGTRR